ncbi:electron transfer flavoprotein-ubiquinone oxidoreductase [Glaciecola petra]|uniref:Electron transfer flavoprotein-ubiquinone oxidoreductase n=1 Tax=Glaciecola petra TaxID=3075602 RepID=A0ABU2ZV23_9ALTE|nr:electron transfer flavoprotein-ubiquinone oxidoreductase [Aestuariibacter sp. P117]MDT0596455.1 electron transfer flavoprotein-ubiquinone oxidoreductase [Aestuariibacter sp. P117]
MEFDVLIVGAGPSGLSAACKIMQLANSDDREISVCVVEKGSEVGAHVLSGAVFDPVALTELFPDWKNQDAPIRTQVKVDLVYFLQDSETAIRIPEFAYPKTMRNEGNYVVSMGNVCRWLGEKAEALGVEVFPGFTAADIIIENDIVKGVITGDMGVGQDGTLKDSYVPGMELRAKQTIFAEGCRGHLGKRLISEFDLSKGKSPQHYGLGFKEIWDVPPEQHQEGLVVHTAGWPLSRFDTQNTGGSYLYHAENGQVVVGLIVDLNYSNPYLSPFDEFQKLKKHPVIAKTLMGGKRVAYGARAIAKGGLNSLPKMTFPGGMIVGCNAGTLNFAKIKGNHTAMKSGMLAAETIYESIVNKNNTSADLISFNDKFASSWIHEELYQSRNFGSAIHKFGPIFGGLYNTIDQNLFNGKLPFRLKDDIEDYKHLKSVSSSQKINYEKHDGVVSFDKLSSVFLSNTNHEEDQPIHLKLTDITVPISVNLKQWDEPAQRYCPAGVYEIVESGNDKTFQINAQNCIHCKTCDIKDPSQNITWVVPEGTGGPNYPNM